MTSPKNDRVGGQFQLPTGLRFFFLLFLLIQFTFFTVSFFLKVLGLFLLPLKLSLCFLLFSFDLRTAASASCSPGIARQKDTAIFFPARRRCRREEAMYCFPSILSFQSTNRFFLLFYRDPPVFNSMQRRLAPGSNPGSVRPWMPYRNPS